MKFPSVGMSFYFFLSRISYLKSYKSKLMVVAFAGTHIPLLALLFYFISTTTIAADDKLRVIGIALVATLIGTAATLLALHSLLSPVGETARALRDYWQKKKLPDLPTDYTDDAGVLMANATQIVKKLDDLIRRLEDYDDLTGLPNRKVFKSQLTKAIATTKPQQKVAVYVIDIDGFQSLNGIEGNGVGDRVLRAIAQRLTHYTSSEDSLARLGNDEFAIFHYQDDALKPDFSTAQEILTLLSKPYEGLSDALRVSVSIGISMYPADGNDAEQLIATAYTALQQAKRKGNSSYEFYSAELAAILQKRRKLTNDLSCALENNQLFLHYQPRIDWSKNEMVGVECLVRWQHPELGKVSPAEFVPLAEETGLILPIGEWILRQACAQSKAWQQSGLPDFTVAVNLSARQIEHPGLVELVQQVLDETELEPRFLELEVTESLLMGDIDHTLSVLQALHDKGIALALDDFGTGYSSLSYLRKFPFDILKIDQAFVKDMVHSDDAAEITRAIVALAKGLQMGLIAEGIETEEQLNQIKGYDCPEVQGYYFSKPVVASEIASLLRTPNPWQRELLKV